MKGLSKVQVGACDLACEDAWICPFSTLLSIQCVRAGRVIERAGGTRRWELTAVPVLFTEQRIGFCDNTLTCPLDGNL